MGSEFFYKRKKVWKDIDYLTMGKYVTKYSKGAKVAMKGLGIVGSVGMQKVVLIKAIRLVE